MLDVAFGAAALGLAAGLQRGWVQPTRGRSSSPSATAADSRFGRDLRNASTRNVVAAGIGTHLPGLIYLAALNAIASERPAPVDAALQVAIYDALWFLVPFASLVLAVVRPGAARVLGCSIEEGFTIYPGREVTGPKPDPARKLLRDSRTRETY